ncbi:NADPH--cytochrome P450 reductase [Pleurostoma richardsiae]|uniref:NADPH--cytochrome P450 reductase n=1 Tax=Pleurostoma richardsiae TaxID=41990 RepID=A0AA38VDJ9_9PEZI|nr:NADPH--cytochrome P450 reductase [Pleurostoma richardsiae]
MPSASTHASKQKLDMVIFWGSQSGRGEMLARRLAKSMYDRFRLRVLAADLDDYDHHHLAQLEKHQPCGFVLSTYGDGDPPDNTNGLWNTLHKLSYNGTALKNLRYIIFGLGNSNYRQFNHVAEHVDNSLQKMGATRYGEAGRGDDANGNTENAFSSWRRACEEMLRHELHLKDHDASYQPSFIIRSDPSVATETVHLGEPHLATSNQPGDARPIPVSSIYKLWEDEERVCIHADLDLGEDRQLKYKTGGHFAIWPSNPNHEVERLVSIMGLSDDQHTPVTIELAGDIGGGKITVASPTTIHALLRYYVEICGPLSPDTITELAAFTSSDSVRSKLRRISENPEVFHTQILAKHATLGDVLEAVGSEEQWNIPLSFLLERLKPMKPRYYSICSSTVVQPRKVSIAAVISKTPTHERGKKTVFSGSYGVTTAYLHALEASTNGTAGNVYMPSFALGGPRNMLEGGRVFGQIRHSAFKLPAKTTTPVIMLGAGTGVAPFRGFIQESARRKELGQEIGKSLLFMGFRRSDLDYIYKDDWTRWQDILGLDVFKFWTAFSREDKDKRVHIQDRLMENAQEVMELLEGGLRCHVYVCGSAAMARDVLWALRSMKMTYSGADEQQAAAWIKELRQSSRLLEDVWG